MNLTARLLQYGRPFALGRDPRNLPFAALQKLSDLNWWAMVKRQDDPACHGYRRRPPVHSKTKACSVSLGTLYVSYGIHHCVNVVTDRADWANGVLLRAVALPDEPERIAAGPGLLARRFGMIAKMTVVRSRANMTYG